MSENEASGKPYWIAGAIAAVAVMAAIVAYRYDSASAGGENSTVLPPKPQWDEQRESMPAELGSGYSAWDKTAFEDKASQEVQSLVEAEQLDAASARHLTENAATVLALYFEGELEPFLDLYRRQGLEPAGNLKDSEDITWKTASIDGNPLAINKIRVIPIETSDGSIALENLPGDRLVRFSPAAPRGPDDIDTTGNNLAGTPVVALVIPTMLTSMEGKAFKGLLVSYFARRSSDGQWILIANEVRALTRPNGTSTGPPPGIFALPI